MGRMDLLLDVKTMSSRSGPAESRYFQCMAFVIALNTSGNVKLYNRNSNLVQ